MSKSTMTKEQRVGLPAAQGLYDPQFEHENCGIGFVANIKGERSYEIVRDAARMLTRMEHRGGCGCESNTGDGAGILTALPTEFLAKVARRDLDIELPEEGRYSAGIVFLPTDRDFRRHCRSTFEDCAAQQGIKILGWRQVPTDADAADVGATSRRCMPIIEQVFVAAPDSVTDREEFERRLFVLRKHASHLLREGDHPQCEMFYVCSLSTKVIVYKGMLSTHQLVPFYLDLQDEDYTSHLAMVHSRYSTNTFPSWDRAQPLRFMSHNGEINTLRGNRNWMYARQGVMESELFSEGDFEKVFPICESRCSDSGNFDNALEMLLMSGRPLPEVVMMMIPEAWQNHSEMPEDKRAFYEYHACLQEPWDGPASISFTDGHFIGAVLDRNGLRPSRYYLTKDDRVIMASEVGALEVPAEDVIEKGRLQPGKMFLVDFEEQRVITDAELKHTVANRRPYSEWVENQRITLEELPAQAASPNHTGEDLLAARMQAFGFSTETLPFMLVPMIKTKKDPIGSMGNDTALACLSEKPRLLFDYFHQLFAQVTNPPIDSIASDHVLSKSPIGPEGNLPDRIHCHRLLVPEPILTPEEMAAIRSLNHRGWTSHVDDTATYPVAEGACRGSSRPCNAFATRLMRRVKAGHAIVVLSDRAISAERVPVASLLAVGAVHQHLVRTEQRTRIGIVIETGLARSIIIVVWSATA
ncbi:MAG: glutamate synthase central domain-containing protein [Pirellulaceae bacterium]